MNYREVKPGNALKSFVKCYYIYQSNANVQFEDVVFPSGCMEIIFNLGDGHWQTASDCGFVTNPAIELWGQITRPLPVKSVGKNIMLGVRFLPQGAAYFLNDKIDLFTNRVVDFSELSGNSVKVLHSKLSDAPEWDSRIELVENFLLKSLSYSEKKFDRVVLVNNIMNEIQREDFFENFETVASRNGITSRYLQKLFLQYTGLTPKLYSKIDRFQNSLRLVTKNETSLTSIAYECGYFDQSHFIREFKSFTGLTPSGYASESSPITVAFANN